MSDYDPNDINAVISAIHTKLDALRDGQEEMRRKQVDNGNKLDSALHRIGALEGWKLWIYGVAAGVAAVVSVLGSGLKWIVAQATGGQH